jgi:hypothetical protein
MGQKHADQYENIEVKMEPLKWRWRDEQFPNQSHFGGIWNCEKNVSISMPNEADFQLTSVATEATCKT